MTDPCPAPLRACPAGSSSPHPFVTDTAPPPLYTVADADRDALLLTRAMRPDFAGWDTHDDDVIALLEHKTRAQLLMLASSYRDLNDGEDMWDALLNSQDGELVGEAWNRVRLIRENADYQHRDTDPQASVVPAPENVLKRLDAARFQMVDEGHFSLAGTSWMQGMHGSPESQPTRITRLLDRADAAFDRGDMRTAHRFVRFAEAEIKPLSQMKVEAGRTAALSMATLVSAGAPGILTKLGTAGARAAASTGAGQAVRTWTASFIGKRLVGAAAGAATAGPTYKSFVPDAEAAEVAKQSGIGAVSGATLFPLTRAGASAFEASAQTLWQISMSGGINNGSVMAAQAAAEGKDATTVVVTGLVGGALGAPAAMVGHGGSKALGHAAEVVADNLTLRPKLPMDDQVVGLVLRHYNPPTDKSFHLIPYLSKEITLVGSLRYAQVAIGIETDAAGRWRPSAWLQGFIESLAGHLGFMTRKGNTKLDKLEVDVGEGRIGEIVNWPIRQASLGINRLYHSASYPEVLRGRTIVGLSGWGIFDRSTHPIFGPSTEIEPAGVFGIKLAPSTGTIEVNIVWAESTMWLIDWMARHIGVDLHLPALPIGDTGALSGAGVEIPMRHPAIAKLLDPAHRWGPQDLKVFMASRLQKAGWHANMNDAESLAVACSLAAQAAHEVRTVPKALEQMDLSRGVDRSWLTATLRSWLRHEGTLAERAQVENLLDTQLSSGKWDTWKPVLSMQDKRIRIEKMLATLEAKDAATPITQAEMELDLDQVLNISNMVDTMLAFVREIGTPPSIAPAQPAPSWWAAITTPLVRGIAKPITEATQPAR